MHITEFIELIRTGRISTKTLSTMGSNMATNPELGIQNESSIPTDMSPNINLSNKRKPVKYLSWLVTRSDIRYLPSRIGAEE